MMMVILDELKKEVNQREPFQELSQDFKGNGVMDARDIEGLVVVHIY